MINEGKITPVIFLSKSDLISADETALGASADIPERARSPVDSTAWGHRWWVLNRDIITGGSVPEKLFEEETGRQQRRNNFV